MKLLVRAETRKLMQTRVLWLLALLTLAVLAVYAYQYTLNAESGVMLEEFRRASVLSSALLLAYASVYSIPLSVTAGSLAIGQEYSNSTQGSLVVTAGRIKPIVAKAVAVLLLSSVSTVAVLAFGVLWGAFVGRGLDGFEPARVVMQLVVTLGVSFSMALIAMAVASLARSTVKSVVVCLLVAVAILTVVANALPWSMRLLPVFAWTSSVARWFDNLDAVHGALEVYVPSGVPLGGAAVVQIVAYIVIALAVQLAIAQWRDTPE